MKYIFLIILASVLMTGCGQKGNLYLPPPPAPEQPNPAPDENNTVQP